MFSRKNLCPAIALGKRHEPPDRCTSRIIRDLKTVARHSTQTCAAELCENRTGSAVRYSSASCVTRDEACRRVRRCLPPCWRCSPTRSVVSPKTARTILRARQRCASIAPRSKRTRACAPSTGSTRDRCWRLDRRSPPKPIGARRSSPAWPIACGSTGSCCLLH